MDRSKFFRAALGILLTGLMAVGGSGVLTAGADAPDSALGFTLPSVTGPYDINVTPGSNETQLNFSWLTQNRGSTQLRYAPAGQVSGGKLPSSAKTVDAGVQGRVVATQGINQDEDTALGDDVSGTPGSANYQDGVYNGNAPAGLFTGEYQSKVTLTGLQAGAKYAYQVSDSKGNWSKLYTIATPSSSSIALAAFGDPQIGAFDNGTGTAKSNATGGHKTLADDKTGWANMLGLVTQNRKLDLLLSLGDEVEDYAAIGVAGSQKGGQWAQYNDFFNPSSAQDFLQSIPLIAFSGNHDHQMGEYYGFHYNQPNLSRLGATQYGNDGDYWFTAGPVLFMVLNSNNYGTAGHDAFMAEAVSKNPQAKWRVAVWHHSAYSESKSHSANNTVEDPILTIRKTWPAMMERHGVDIVLQGHDHYYTRTAQLLGGNVIDPATGETQTLALDTSRTAGNTTTNPNLTFAAKQYPSSVTNPKGVVYFTLDSGSGSKFYDYGTSSDHTFSVVGWQGYVPTYSYLTFSNGKFTIDTYSSTDYQLANQKKIDSYTILKTSATASNNPSSTPATGTTSSESNPKTGDASSDMAYTVVALLLFAGILTAAAVLILRKRESK